MAKTIFTTKELNNQEQYLIDSCYQDIQEICRYQLFVDLKIMRIDDSWYAKVTLEPDNLSSRKSRKKQSKLFKGKYLNTLLWDMSEFVSSRASLPQSYTQHEYSSPFPSSYASGMSII